MPDIIDIMMAKALTPQGQIEGAAAQAQKAVRDANAAVANINSITEQTQQNNTDAAAALADATTALEDAQSAQQLVEEALEDIATAVDSMEFTVGTVSSSDVVRRDVFITYPSEKQETLTGVSQYYTATGQNTDGTMTQKAITDALNTLDEKIDEIEPTTDLDPANNGKIVVVDEDGNIAAGTVSQQEIIDALIGGDTSNDILGIEIDYANKFATRTNKAVGRTMGSDFDKFLMYGGRVRCNVTDDGAITAFYGDANFAADGSNGQVMVYQPKFYYSRIPAIIENDHIIRKEAIAISETAHPGFTLHPLFINEEGEEVDYVLLSAFEGSTYTVDTATYNITDVQTIDFTEDKLSSISGAKPISGLTQNLTMENLSRLADNRGTGWLLTDLRYESAMQMLEMIEFGMLNGQSALGKGLSNIPNNQNYNCSSITGSTLALGNASGAATSTINEINNVRTTYTENGKVAISYRGVENPWGNIWRAIDRMYVTGNGSQRGGIAHIYNPVTKQYVAADFSLPNNYSWISAFGYDSAMNWIFIPIECNNANSALPVGDNLWTKSNLNATYLGWAGGLWSFNDNNGPFYYAFDREVDGYGHAYSGRLMYLPTKNSIYEANYAAWQNKMGVS